MHQIYEDTMKKVRRLKDQGFEVKQKWECKFTKEMKHNEEMKCYFEEYEHVDPLQPVTHSTGDVPMQQNYSTNVRATRRSGKKVYVYGGIVLGITNY